MESPRLLHGVASAPATAEEAYRNFLSMGETYFAGGVEVRTDGRAYVEAWPAVLSYLRAHRQALQSWGVVEAELAAGSRLCRELAEALEELAETPPLPLMLHRSVVETAIARLERARSAVRRGGQEVASAEFGLSLPLDPSRPLQVARAIGYFLEGAQRHLDRLHLFQLVTADLEELKAQRRALLSLCAPSRSGEPITARADRLLAALDGLYASLATAIALAFPPEDRRRQEGLRRIAQVRQGADRPLDRCRSWP
ncbi:MAG: hypothetical protein RMK29_14560 [Myxococcales bacterium]|nr:hypothetical protein [Myxococcota bacterium]MDW8282934.1 hypothetical protein [Myxococcales bacterium]